MWHQLVKANTLIRGHHPLEEWGKLIGDVPSATAILDRFLHDAEIIQITGRSYRLRNEPDDSVQDSTVEPTGAEVENGRCSAPQINEGGIIAGVDQTPQNQHSKPVAKTENPG